MILLFIIFIGLLVAKTAGYLAISWLVVFAPLILVAAIPLMWISVIFIWGLIIAFFEVMAK